MPIKSDGDTIRGLRAKTGLSTRAFARKHQIDYSTLWRIENGKLDGSAETQKRLAEAFGVQVERITYYEEPAIRAVRVAA